MASVTKENEGNRAGTPDDPSEGESVVLPTKGTDQVRSLDSAKRSTPRSAGYFTIYKKGQGYWTRMGTLLAVAVIGLMLGYTLYSEIPNYGGSADTTDLNAVVRQQTDESNKQAEEIARLKGALIAPDGTPSPSAAADYAAAETRKAAIDAKIVDTRAQITAANSRYAKRLQNIATVVAVVFLAAFAGVGLWLMNKPRYVDFMIATDSEMKKVNWTSRRELMGSSKVVIIFMLLMALYLFVNDTIFGYLMYLIKVLKVPPPPFS